MRHDEKKYACIESWKPFFMGFFFIVLFEMIAVSLLLSRWSIKVVAAHAVLSLLTLIWMARKYSGLGENLSFINDDGVHLRIGPFHEFVIPLQQIAAVVSSPYDGELPRFCASLTPFGSPEIVIKLKEAMSFPKMRRKEITEVGFCLDDSRGFMNELLGRLV